MIDWLVTTAVVLLVLALVALLVVRAGVKRGRRWLSHGQHLLLEMRVHALPPGPRRDATMLRRRLAAEVRATQQALADAPGGLIFRADAARVLAELTASAADMDRELAAVERFLDAAEQRRALEGLTPQVTQLIAATYSARHTVLRTAAEDRARRLAELAADLQVQADSLESYRRSRDLPLL
jgi:hypothetical protein